MGFPAELFILGIFPLTLKLLRTKLYCVENNASGSTRRKEQSMDSPSPSPEPQGRLVNIF